MRGVALVQPKGGVGKTSLSHALALGAAWKLVPAYFMHTDDRVPLIIQNRPYMYYDARSPETLSNLMSAAVNADGYCIVDSGGNRPEFDSWIARAVDLVLIPITPDSEAIKLGIEHKERLSDIGATNVKYILNMVSSNSKERQRDFEKYFSKLPSNCILGQIPRVNAIKRLREDDDSPFKTPPTPVNNLARKMFSIVNNSFNQRGVRKELSLEA